ncbi:hypothetical protein [Bradyrhizobium cosmicum]|uniref:hypothetical protein n=1 Tax=Bradyrhizobium cosmicum TaxID=1404864 RepID=UPI0028EC225C|nr:hypothetical protein [Bradyrhizobium cosmicum]
MSKALHYQAMARAVPGTVYRAMPDEVALRVYQANRKTYDPILKRRDPSDALGNVKASVLLISGCAQQTGLAPMPWGLDRVIAAPGPTRPSKGDRPELAGEPGPWGPPAKNQRFQ